MNDRSRIRDSAALKRRPRVRRVIREVTEPGLVHPALIPGIGVEKTGKKFSTIWAVFAVAGVAVVAVILWAVFAPDSISVAGDTSLSWVIDNFGCLFGVLAVCIAMVKLILGYGRTGGIWQGTDDEKPEYATMSWLDMVFAADMRIDLQFYDPCEPLTYFMDLPIGFDAADGSAD